MTCEKSKWENFDYSAHYYVGNGQARTLQSMGLADDVWSIVERDVINRNGGLLDQLNQLAGSLIDKSQANGTVAMSYNTRNSYDFQEASWPIRMATLMTSSRGSVSWTFNQEENLFYYSFSVSTSFSFIDTFSDPLNLETLGLPRMDMPLCAPYLIVEQWNKILTGSGTIPE